MAIKELKNLLSFLTIFPVAMDKDMLTDCAKRHVGFSADRLFHRFDCWRFRLGGWPVCPGIVVGGLVLAALLLITGLHHTDGLA